ncbi:MAG: DUF3943 domain-containing protein [Bacteroidales bacterium]
MKTRIVSIITLFTLAINCFANVRIESAQDTLHTAENYVPNLPKKNFWATSGMVVGTNFVFWGFSKYITKEHFADISLATMKKNLCSEFVWDNDELSTNLIGHPYQGGLYFSAARANNYTFIESLPFAFVGSLAWEYLFENEPPSINDMIATPFAGAAFGEIMHRTSSLILDGSATGFNRASREAVSLLINPPRGILRLINGDAWKKGRKAVDELNSVPFDLSAGLGLRYLVETGERANRASMLTLNLRFKYNDPFDLERNLPFEYYNLNASLNLGGNQPMLGELSFQGILFGKNLEWKKQNLLIGAFQNYRYVDMNQFKTNEGNDPFRMSETVSGGVGAIYRAELPAKKSYFNAEAYFSGVLLGGVLTDYYNFGKRNYNFGTGFSFSALAEIQLKRFKWLTTVYGMKLYSPEGYENKDFENIDQLHLDAMGDTGNSYVSIFKNQLSFDITDWLSVAINSNWYFRTAKYKYRPFFYDNIMDYNLSLSYQF